MALSDVTKMTACKLAWQTADAYSADCFGPVLWVEAAQMLIDMDFTEQQVRAILRSKLTRWARDAWGEPSTYLGKLAILVYNDRENIRAGSLGDGEIMQEQP